MPKNPESGEPRRAGLPPERADADERKRVPKRKRTSKREREISSEASEETLKRTRDEVVNEAARASEEFVNETSSAVAAAEKKAGERMDEEESSALDGIILQQEEAHAKLRELTDEDIEDIVEGMEETIELAGSPTREGRRIHDDNAESSEPKNETREAESPEWARNMVAHLITEHPVFGDAFIGGRAGAEYALVSLRDENPSMSDRDLERELRKRFIENALLHKKQAYAAELTAYAKNRALAELPPDRVLANDDRFYEEIVLRAMEQGSVVDVDDAFEAIRGEAAWAAAPVETARADAGAAASTGDGSAAPSGEAASPPEAEALRRARRERCAADAAAGGLNGTEIREAVQEMFDENPDAAEKFGGFEAMVAAAVALTVAERLSDVDALKERLEASEGGTLEELLRKSEAERGTKRKKTPEELAEERRELEILLRTATASAGDDKSPDFSERLSKWWEDTFLKPTAMMRFMKKFWELFK